MSGYRFSRRNLLAKVGGCAALLPLLNARRGLAAPLFPRRLVVMQPTNGVLAGTWWPSGGEADFALNATMGPLEPHKKDLLILRGIEMAAMKLGKPAGVGAWGGHEALPFLLTGVQGALSQYDGSVRIAVGNGVSLDWYVGTKLGTSIPSLVLGAAATDSKLHWGAVSFRGPAVGSFPATPALNQPQIDPRMVFDRLFATGTPATGAPAVDLTRIKRRKASVLDVVRRDLADVSAAVGGDDRARIEAHLQGLRDVEQEIAALSAGGSASCVTPTVPGGLVPTDRMALDKLLPVQSRLIAAALRCGLTQSAVLQMCTSHNNGVAFPFLGAGFTTKISGVDNAGDGSAYWTHHMIAHNAARVPDQKNAVDKWFVQVFANMIQMLKEIPEGGGTLFDNTAILYANNMGDGAAHSITDLPWILAGSCGGAFKTGRYLQLGPTANNKVLTTLANVLLEGKAAPIAGFGDARFAGELTRLRG